MVWALMLLASIREKRAGRGSLGSSEIPALCALLGEEKETPRERKHAEKSAKLQGTLCQKAEQEGWGKSKRIEGNSDNAAGQV